MSKIRRRQFLIATGALLTAQLAPAQQPGRPYRIALLPDFSPRGEPLLKLFVERLRESGRIEGRDYVLYRSGSFYGGEATLALDRVLEAKPDLILATNLGYAIAAHEVTKTIPIVMWVSGFPVEGGVAESLARPGKNVTGLTIYAGAEVFGKLLQLLHETKPRVRRIGVFMSYIPPFHPRAVADVIVREMRNAAGLLGLDLRIFEIAKSEHVDDALGSITAQGVEALVLTSDPSMRRRSTEITRFAVAKHLPTIVDAPWPGTEPQPLLGYWAPFDVLIRQAAPYVNQILWGGAKPGDLPIQLPAKFEFVVNLKTAKALGLTIPLSLLRRADQVIQ
jgi:putative ABC transport system substrate-binding protein